MKKALCVMSGGMDSAVSAAVAKSEGYEILALHFDYAQRTQSREKKCFLELCTDFGAKSFIFDATFIATIGGSALTDFSIEVPKNREFSDIANPALKLENRLCFNNDQDILLNDKIASKNAFAAQMLQSKVAQLKGEQMLENSAFKGGLPITYVPFRNGIFLSIAAALAQKEGCNAVFLGLVEADSSGYPDCSQDFLSKMQSAIRSGSGTSISLFAPLINKSKGEIVALGARLGVDFSHTYSCYERDDEPCGECDSCKLRARGFAEVSIKDPILTNKIK